MDTECIEKELLFDKRLYLVVSVRNDVNTCPIG